MTAEDRIIAGTHSLADLASVGITNTTDSLESFKGQQTMKAFKYCPQCGDVVTLCPYDEEAWTCPSHCGDGLIDAQPMTLPQGFTSCGLNADWSVSAWHFGMTPRGSDGALYIVDNEDIDGTFSIVSRQFNDDDNDVIEELFTFKSFAAAIGAACIYKRRQALFA